MEKLDIVFKKPTEEDIKRIKLQEAVMSSVFVSCKTLLENGGKFINE